MEEKNNKKEKEEKEEKSVSTLKKTAVTIGGAVAVGAGSANVVEVVDSNELDLLHTVNSAGKPTGHGNMFENVIVRENPGSYKVNNPGSSQNPLLREKNGVDVRLPDGTDVQAKCCYSSEKAVESLMKDGKFRYDGQTIYVPKGQGRQVRKLLKEQGVDAYVRESKYTYEEVRALCNPGWKSAKFDATDPNLMIAAGLMGAIVAGTVYMYLHVSSSDKPWWKKALIASGWGIGAFTLVELIVVGYGQYKRF